MSFFRPEDFGGEIIHVKYAVEIANAKLEAALGPSVSGQYLSTELWVYGDINPTHVATLFNIQKIPPKSACTHGIGKIIWASGKDFECECDKCGAILRPKGWEVK